MRPIAILLASLTIAACGSAKTFTADELVGKISDQGVQISLGDPLYSEGQNKEIYAVELAPVVELPGARGEDSRAHGSIAVYKDEDGASAGLDNCKAVGEFSCFQAANVVVIIESGGLEVQQLGVAIGRLDDP